MRSEDKPDPIEEARREGKAIVDKEFAGLEDGAGGNTNIVNDEGAVEDEVPVEGEDEEQAPIGTGDTTGEGETEGDELDELEAAAAEERKTRDDTARAAQDADDKAKGIDRAGQVRDAKGQWRKETDAEKTARETAAAAPAAKPGEATPASAADPKVAEQAARDASEKVVAEHLAKLTWTGLGVKVKDQMMEVPEGSFAKVGDHMMVRIPLDKVPAFQSRMAKAVVAEKMWRDLQTATREIEREKDAPKPESDDQIKSRLIVEMLEPFLKEILTPEQVENLELRIQVAQNTAKETHATARKTYFDELEKKERDANAPGSEEVHAERVTTALFQVLKEAPEFAGMTRDELRAAQAELLELRNLITINGENWLYDAERVARALKNAKGRATAAPDAGTGTPAPAGTTPKPAAPAAAARAELHNDGAKGGTKPGSTSLRDKRDAGPTRRNGAPPGTRRTPPEKIKSAAQIAEDESRAEISDYMRSNEL